MSMYPTMRPTMYQTMGPTMRPTMDPTMPPKPEDKKDKLKAWEIILMAVGGAIVVGAISWGIYTNFSDKDINISSGSDLNFRPYKFRYGRF